MIFSHLRNKRRTAVEIARANVGRHMHPKGAETLRHRLRAACMGGIRARRPFLQLISYDRIDNCARLATYVFVSKSF